MKVDVKNIDSTKRELTVEVTGDVVKNKFEDVFKKIGDEAKVKGFRPGKVPRDILEKEFSSLAHEQVLKELVPQVYNEAIGSQDIDVIELPEITDVQLDRSRLSFKATVETSPEIKIKNYKGIKVVFKKPAVTPDEIKRHLDTVKESKKIETMDDAFARGAGYPNLGELEKAFERQLLVQKENQQRRDIENMVIEHITKDLEFKIPQSLVDRQLQDLVRQAKMDLAMRGYPREKIDEQEAQMRKRLESDARRQVKVYLVLSAIAKAEKIALDDHMPQRTIELLLKEANWKEE